MSNDDRITIYTSPAEVALVLQYAAFTHPRLYREIRDALPLKDFATVARLASNDGLEALDIIAGYTPANT